MNGSYGSLTGQLAPQIFAESWRRQAEQRQRQQSVEDYYRNLALQREQEERDFQRRVQALQLTAKLEEPYRETPEQRYGREMAGAEAVGRRTAATQEAIGERAAKTQVAIGERLQQSFGQQIALLGEKFNRYDDQLRKKQEFAESESQKQQIARDREQARKLEWEMTKFRAQQELESEIAKRTDETRRTLAGLRGAEREEVGKRLLAQQRSMAQARAAQIANAAYANRLTYASPEEAKELREEMETYRQELTRQLLQPFDELESEITLPTDIELEDRIRKLKPGVSNEQIKDCIRLMREGTPEGEEIREELGL